MGHTPKSKINNHNTVKSKANIKKEEDIQIEYEDTNALTEDMSIDEGICVSLTLFCGKCLLKILSFDGPFWKSVFRHFFI